MEGRIRLYRDDGRHLGDLPLLTILQPALEQILGRSLHGTALGLMVYAVRDEALIAGTPTLVNLSADYGYVRAIVKDQDLITYNHPHTVHELLGQRLQAYLRDHYPDQDLWGFYLIADGLPSPPPAIAPLDNLQRQFRSKPEVEGGVAVTPYADGELPGFRIRKIEEPPPPEASLDDFPLLTGGGDREAFVKVLVPETVHADLLERRRFSNDMEEGGFLTGRVFRDRDAPGTYLVRVDGALPAEHTGASLLQFTYTGDSFSAVKRVLREQRPDECLLGWYHTHLFAASDAMGLSSIDLELHFTTFRQPWQLAGLINLDPGGPRVLRFYVRRQTLMTPCPTWVLR